jgi:anti-anti-sigma factor
MRCSDNGLCWLQASQAVLLQFHTKRIAPDITVLELAGKIVMGPESQSVEKLVNDLLGQDRKKIILDLTAVGYIDSAGLGTIAHSFFAVRGAGGRLHLAGATGRVEQEFRTTKLDAVIALYPTVEAACEAFGVKPDR